VAGLEILQVKAVERHHFGPPLPDVSRELFLSV
jgi:hypothetical protein